jgi:hypothetical protein
MRTYLKNIDSFMARVLAETSKVGEGANSQTISSVVKFIQQTCEYTLAPAEQFRVLQGILIGLLNIATEGSFCVESALTETADVSEDSNWQD